MPGGCRESKQTGWGEGHSLPLGTVKGGLSSDGLTRHIRTQAPSEAWLPYPGGGGWAAGDPHCALGVARGWGQGLRQHSLGPPGLQYTNFTE